MPRVSERQRTLRYLNDKIELNMALASSSSDDDNMDTKSIADNNMAVTGSDSDIELLISYDSEHGGDPYELEGCVSDLLELYFVMDGTRYFVERPMTNKPKDFVLNFFHDLPMQLFRQMTRMDKRSFFELVGMIDQDHPIFHNSSTAAQAPVAWQLAVCLDRLGHDGNGACLNHLIPTWGVSNGSLCNFTSRCFTVLGTALQGLLKWPDRAERAHISNEFAKKGFPGCVGLIDGTLIPLSQRPAQSGECYYDRKCWYSMNAQVICDHRRKILLLYTGPCGSVSDLTCFRRTSLCRDMDKLGSPVQA